MWARLRRSSVLGARLRRFDFFYILLFFVALILLRQFFQVDYVYGHDSLYHISSIEAIREALGSGQFNLDLLPTVAYGFGYGSGMFYAQFFHVAAAILSFLVGDVIFAIKLVHLVSFFLSGAVMYLLLKKVLGGSEAFSARSGSSLRTRMVAFLGACFYLSAPFHIADHLVRDAEAELLIFLFIPLILLGLVYLLEAILLERKTAGRVEANVKNALYGMRKRFYFCFVIGYAGLLLSNSAIAIFFTIFLAIALAVEFLLSRWTSRRGGVRGFEAREATSLCGVDIRVAMKPLLVAVALVSLIVAPFYVNLMQQKSADLVVFSEQTTANNHYYLENEAASFTDLFVPSVDTSYLAIPLALNICAVILAIYAIFRAWRFGFFRLMFIVAALALFATSALFPWGAIPDLLSPLQFPWRLETILLPALTILAAFGLSELFGLFDPQALPFSKSRNLLPIAFMSVFVLVSCAYYSTLVQHDFELNYDATSYDAAYYGLGWGHEYLPERANLTTAGTVSNSGTPSSEMALGRRGGGVIVENGATVATITKNETLALEATVGGAVFPATIELPRLYYLGYDIEFTNAAGATTKLDYSESERGMVEVVVPSAGTIKANYRGTTLVQVLKIVSGVTILILIFYLIIPKSKRA